MEHISIYILVETVYKNQAIFYRNQKLSLAGRMGSLEEKSHFWLAEV